MDDYLKELFYLDREPDPESCRLDIQLDDLLPEGELKELISRKLDQETLAAFRRGFRMAVRLFLTDGS